LKKLVYNMELPINKNENILSSILFENRPAEKILEKLQEVEKETDLGSMKRLKEIGKGSYGEVSKCELVLNGKKTLCAIKKPRARGKEPPFDFFREAYILNMMREREQKVNLKPGERLVKLLGLRLNYTKVLESLMITSFLGDRNLKKYVANMERVSLHEIRRITSQILTALEELRSRSIIHRDLKLENFVMDEESQVRLCDFGMATDFAGVHVLTGTDFGTKSTMPPERMLSIGHYGYAYDVWSAACVIFSLITGGALMVPNSGGKSVSGRKNLEEFLLKNILSILGSEIPRPRNNVIQTGWRKLHEYLRNVEPKARLFKEHFISRVNIAIENNKLSIDDREDCIRFGEDLSTLAHWYGPSRAVISRKSCWRRKLPHLVKSLEDQKGESKDMQLYPIDSIEVEKLPKMIKLTGKLSQKGRRKKKNILRAMEDKRAFEANHELRKKHSLENKKRKVR